MRLARASTPVAVCLLAGVSACGGGNGAKNAAPPPSPVTEKFYGAGAGQVWVFRPRKLRPKALVVFFHGLGDQRETTPYHHRPWLRHLAANGNVVFYPRFEQYPGQAGALRNAIGGIRTAMARTTLPPKLPVVVIGYSRGGGLGFDYTAIAPAVGPIPRAVLEVFPAMMDATLDLRGIVPGTRFVFLVGENDTTVGAGGASRLISQLAAVDYPRRWIKEELVRTHEGFVADHLSVLQTTPGARAAFWRRADRLIAGVTARKT